ncbi:FadR/GntR family transcriptional regulator [uncultured Cohaesibacter sp.]|uniref:FadR/GntR family transcriptional regulator n=1 Tax=uncultured Cohaesibacter sp. TaxID=1002546 RepID=UPI002AAABC98|nr:FadR/GntR family transcriptional regulator [uncultured Cohaesibacter sp.]
MSVEEASTASGGSLTDRTARQIEQMIAERSLKPGDRLPTVQDLSRRLGVSLSVVREAIASLRAGGVLHTRRGAGIFVAEPSAIDNRGLFFGDLSQISSVVEILELRLAVEVEAAGLAAERHSMAQESRIYEAYEAIEAVMELGGTGETEDSLFHIAIAEATNNRRFVDFLTQLGNAMIPRNKLRPLPASHQEHIAYLAQLQDEHRVILDAISGKDPEAARNAMRAHLSLSRDRYHSMIKAKTALR